MSDTDFVLEKYLSQHKNEDAVKLCLDNKEYFLALFLSRLLKNIPNELEKRVDSEISLLKKCKRIKLLTNWCTSEYLVKLWNKMSQGNYCWNDLMIVWEDPVDYYVIINAPPENVTFDKKKTIVFRMEPNMSKNDQWKDWKNPDEKEFLKVFKHENGDFNNNEWHLSKTYAELMRMKVEKNKEYDSIVSTVLSDKYHDSGHVKRVDFVKFLDKKGLVVHVYGGNKWGYKNYKGVLPYHCKDDAIFPYKYTFNGENQNIANYFTEKLIDGILGECLVFYSGCYNIRRYFDSRAFVHLELSNFEKDYQTIMKAIKEDWHSQRLPFIREAKNKILNEYQFFPRLDNLLKTSKIYLPLFNGLGNRIIPLVSGLRLAKMSNRRLAIYWPSHTGRSNLDFQGEHSKFTDLFIMPENVEITTEKEINEHRDRCDWYDFSFMNTTPRIVDVNSSKDIAIIYAISAFVSKQDDKNVLLKFKLDRPGLFQRDSVFNSLCEACHFLEPIPRLKQEIESCSKKFTEKMIGIHLRRTDGGFKDSNWTETDKALFKRALEWKKEGYTIFLATDSAEHQKLYGNSVIVSENVNKFTNTKENTESAVVDMYLLSKCQVIIGTMMSTFGLTAMMLSKDAKYWVVSEDPESVVKIVI